MPEQKFSDPVSGSEVVAVSWDMGMRAVDIAFGGTLLTQVTDLEPLRATGMQGAAPDGSHLVVRLVRSAPVRSSPSIAAASSSSAAT